MDDMRAFHDIIYRALFGMDTRALLIHFGLPAEYYDDPDDDELCDSMGTLALAALGECHGAFSGWVQCQHGQITKVSAKRNLRWIAGEVAKQYKARALELDGDLLTLMKL